MGIHTLVIAPHPDDELLGVGGTLFRRKAEGRQIAWLIVTNISEKFGWSSEQTARRNAEIKAVAERVQFNEVINLGLPPAELDSMPRSELVNAFSRVFKTLEPEEVYVPHAHDVHSDHRIVSEAAASCTKWFRYPSVKRVLAYETLSETDFVLGREQSFVPNVFIDIEHYLSAKVQALSIYSSEIGDFPFPRSVMAVESLARLRGSASGFKAAEAFELLRERV